MIKRNEKTAAVLEAAYLGIVAVISLMAFNYTTMSGIDFPGWLRHAVLLAAALIAAARIVFDRRLGWPTLALAVLFAPVLYFAGKNAMQGYMAELAVLILGAQGIRFEKIVKVYLAAVLTALLVTMGLALGGVLENLIYRENDSVRISFGIAYPTDFAAHVFFLVCCWTWLREKKTSWAEIVGVFLTGVFCLVFCRARNTVICLFLIALGICCVRIRRTLKRHKGTEYTMNRVLSALLCAAMPILAAAILLLSYLYTPETAWIEKLDSLLSCRLSIARQGFEQYPVTLLGQYVQMQGNGNALEHTGVYFWLDSSYVNILLRLGVLTLLGVLAVFVTGALRQRRLGSWERLFILTVIALHCTIEHHLIEIAYHPFLLMALAANTAETEKGTEA